MSSESLAESTRRRLSSRQADTVSRLTEAAIEELRSIGYAGLTVRNVAARGGVAPATAYTYFSSKNHLITEVFWRRLQTLPLVSAAPTHHPEPKCAGAAPAHHPEPKCAGADNGSTVARVVRVLREIALLVADEPELASACTSAILGEDPDVRLLRERIGVEWHRRLHSALGDNHDPAVLWALETALVGALTQAGMGSSYARMADRLESAARLIMEGRS